jgi:hypothetical protein
MDTTDINTLIEILKHHKRRDLVSLISNCRSQIQELGSYGDGVFSSLANFVIFAPVESFYKLKKLKAKDKKFILECVTDMYPKKPNSIEIVDVTLEMAKEEQPINRIEAVYIGRTTRAFISYHTNDKYLAGQIKTVLEYFGIEVFLAHEDIDPAHNWQETILENLKSTDIFLPLMTSNFANSDWTDQESGMALGYEKLILPISIDGHHPYGFVNKFQSLKIDPAQKINGETIIKSILKAKPQLQPYLIDSIIKSFILSRSWEEAKIKSRFLKGFELSKDQVEEIFKGAIKNSQIYDSFGASDNLKVIYEKYKNILPKEKITEIVAKFNGFDPDLSS